MGLRKLNLGNLKSALTDLQSFYDKRNKLFKDMEKLYFMEDSIGIAPQGTDNVQLPTGYDVVEKAVAILASEVPTISIPRRKRNQKAQELAETMEKVLLGIFYRSERELRRSLLRDLIWHGVVRGWMVTKTLFNDKAREGRLPIFIQVRDPQFIYPMFTSEGVSYVIESYRRKAGEVRDVWPSSRLRGKKDLDEVDWLEYWDDTHYCYVCDDEVILKPTEHAYGFIPYSIAFGYSTPMPVGERMGMGLLYPVRDTIKAQNRLFAQKEAIIKKYAWPTFIVVSPDGKRIELKVGEGSINYLLPEEEVYILEGKGPPPDVDRQMNLIQGTLDRSTFPGVLYGEQTQGSALKANVLATSASSRLDPVKKSAEWLLSDVNQNVLRLIETFVPRDQDFTVWGLDEKASEFEVTIKPKDIKGYYLNFVTLRLKLPQDDYQKAMLGLRLVQADIISRQRAMDKYAGVESTQDELSVILAEKAMMNPAVMQELSVEAVREWLGEDIANRLEQAMMGGQGSPIQLGGQLRKARKTPATPPPGGLHQPLPQGGPQQPTNTAAQEQAGAQAARSTG